MTDDSLLWEDIPDAFKVHSVKLNEGQNWISPITIDTFTAEGKKKYDEGVSIKEMVEGVDFVRVTQSYESFLRPEINGASYNNRYHLKKAKVAVLALIALSPMMQIAKDNAEKYLACREYRVERDNRGEYLVGIDCRLKAEEKAIMQKAGYWRI